MVACLPHTSVSHRFEAAVFVNKHGCLSSNLPKLQTTVKQSAEATNTLSHRQPCLSAALADCLTRCVHLLSARPSNLGVATRAKSTPTSLSLALARRARNLLYLAVRSSRGVFSGLQATPLSSFRELALPVRRERVVLGLMPFFFFFFITLGLEMSDTKVYEP